MFYCNDGDIFRQNAMCLLGSLSGHRAEDYRNVQRFLRDRRPIDWGLVLSQLEHHGLFAIFWNIMDGIDQIGVEFKTRTLIRKMCEFIEERSCILAQAFNETYGELGTLGDDIIVIKGFVLNNTVYPAAGWENARCVADVDMIVNPAALEDIAEKFEDMGYSLRRKPNGICATRSTNNCIYTRRTSFDLHSGNPSKLSQMDRQNTWEFFSQSAETLNIEGISRPCRIPNASTHFVTIANHSFEHSQRFVNILLLDDIKWQRFMDLELLAPQADPEAVSDAAKRLGWSACLDYLIDAVSDIARKAECTPMKDLELFCGKMQRGDSDSGLVDRILMPDGSHASWPISFYERIFEPRRAHYMEDLLGPQGKLELWYSVSKGGMQHGKLAGLRNQPAECSWQDSGEIPVRPTDKLGARTND